MSSSSYASRVGCRTVRERGGGGGVQIDREGHDQ